MKKILVLCFLFAGIILTPVIKGQALEKNNFIYKNGHYDIFILKVDTSLEGRIGFADNNNLRPEDVFFDSLNKKLNSPFFAITASITDSSCQPLGLYVRDKKTIRSINLGTGSGNFYLKPNGVFCIDNTYGILVQNSVAYNENNPVSLAIQSGPLLINNGLINNVFDKNSKNKFIRCGVGTYTDNNGTFMVFIKSVVPVTFYQLAQVFEEKFDCKNALTLESGTNCSMHLPSEKKISAGSQRYVCRYLVIRM